LLQNKKIAFFTEGNYYSKIPRNFSNMRTDCAWICALNAVHIPLYEEKIQENFDLGIIIIPKKWFVLNFNAIPILRKHINENIRKYCKKIAIMQEANQEYFQDSSIQHQFEYIKILMDADFLFCHNDCDVSYFYGLTGKNVYVLQSLMITDLINSDDIFTRQEAVMLGGTICQWYSGIDSYVIAKEMNIQIFAPSMGRKKLGEDNIMDIKYLQYVPWYDWMMSLRKMSYGIHLMRVYAAGTFALNCSFLSLPCIGYENCDTQRKLHHSSLSLKEGDLDSARCVAYELVNDKDFYDECSVLTRYNYEKLYTEEKFIEKFNEILEYENI